MTPHGKASFTNKKYKVANFLRNGFRILFLIIFLHWILWLTSYANCVNYQEAISEKNVKEEEKKLKEHNNKTEKYQHFSGLFNEKKEKNITEIEEDILNQIEQKKGLKKDDKLRIWKKEKLPELEKLHGEIKGLQKENPTKEEKEELEKKQKKYDDELKKAKEETVKNIEDQLVKNELNITELDDNRGVGQQILHDPLKFFIVSPLNKTSKLLGLHNLLFLEIIFKLLIIEIAFVLICYSETIVMWENMEKARDPHISVEERDQLNLEASSLFKYALFNGCMMMLFNFFLTYHPAFFDRTRSIFQPETSWKTAWWFWVVPISASLLLSNISTEYLHQGRLLTKRELKVCVAKSWVVSLVLALGLMAFMRWVGMSSVGSHLLVLLGGLVKFAVNIVRVKFFGHREHLPNRGTRTYPKNQ